MIIIALYIYVGNLPKREINELLSMTTENINGKNKSDVTYHIIPVSTGETKMELIYPPNLNIDTIKNLLDIKDIK